MKRLNLAIPMPLWREMTAFVKKNALRYRSVTQFIVLACRKFLDEQRE